VLNNPTAEIGNLECGQGFELAEIRRIGFTHQPGFKVQRLLVFTLAG
jgi:hypothetical protein